MSIEPRHLVKAWSFPACCWGWQAAGPAPRDAPAAAAESEEWSKTVPAKPTPQQAAWQDMEVGMFIHFAPNTWQDKEGDDLSTPLDEDRPGQTGHRPVGLSGPGHGG